MTFAFVSSPAFNFLTSFGAQFGIPVQGDTLIIPPSMGQGSIRKIDLGPAFKLLIHQYTLNDDLVLQRLPAETPFDLISILFHSNELPVSLTTPDSRVQLSRTSEFAVQIASADLESVVRFPANVPINYTVVGLSSATFRQLLRAEPANPSIQSILNGEPGVLLYEPMGPDVRQLLDQLTNARQADELTAFFYRIKVEELLYQVVATLLRRETHAHSPINRHDSDKLLALRTTILTDLSQPPHLPDLARTTGMSETKLKALFRQVFGDSIYAHFQKARLAEAARLLRQGYSVSDVGYQLGFANLSHFSRVFASQHGVKPKAYAAGA